MVKKKKKNTSNAIDSGLVSESGRSSGEVSGYPLQYSLLDNSIEEPVGLQYTESRRIRQD